MAVVTNLVNKRAKTKEQGLELLKSLCNFFAKISAPDFALISKNM